MGVLVGKDWKSGFLGEVPRPDTCRISVRKWRVLEPAHGSYFVRERSLRILWNYLLEIGALGIVLRLYPV